MPSSRERAVTGVPDDRWTAFGAALAQRRENVLGYPTLAAMSQARDINYRLIQELESNSPARVNSYTVMTMRNVARAYRVTYASILDFLHGRRDDLDQPLDTPALMAAEDDPGWTPPVADPGRQAANAPWFAAILERLHGLRDQGFDDPSGARLFDDPRDAEVWDGTRGRFSLMDRAYMIADMQRREAARRADDPAANPGTARLSAL